MKKVAIIGEGESFEFYAKSIQQSGQLLAICSSEEGKTNECIIEQNVTAYRSIDELLKNENEINVVVVCSPVGFHAEHIIKSLQAGKDVLCESPLCLTKAAAWQIIETEKYCGRRLYLIQTPFFSSLVTSVKRSDFVERSGKARKFQLDCATHLSEQFLSGPNGKQFPGGGLLYKPFGLLVDLLISLFGEIEAVEGSLLQASGKPSSDIEEAGSAVLRMQSGITGTLNWSGLDNNACRLSITYENGAIEMLLDETELFLLYSDAQFMEEDSRTKFYEDAYDTLLKALRGEDVSFPGSLDGARTVETIEKIYKALR